MKCDVTGENSFNYFCNCTGFLLLANPNQLEDISTPESLENIVVRISLDGAFTKDDISTIKTFIKEFNELSSTIKLSEEISTGREERLQIKFYPPSSLNSIDRRPLFKDPHIIGIKPGPNESFYKYLPPYYPYYFVFKNNKTQEIMYICSDLSPDERIERGWKGNVIKIYINSELSGDQRSHYTLHSLLYVLGFRGSIDNPASIFYSGENSNVQLNSIDKDVIQEAYGPRLVTLLKNSCMGNELI
jgi:hypothetical protein